MMIYRRNIGKDFSPKGENCPPWTIVPVELIQGSRIFRIFESLVRSEPFNFTVILALDGACLFFTLSVL